LRLQNGAQMRYNKEQLTAAFLEKNKRQVETLFSDADRCRKECVGDEVYLRGVIEFSNYCRMDCLYCGLRRSNASLKRYRMEAKEILESAALAAGLRIPTIVLQSGEDKFWKIKDICLLVEKIKKLGVAVTLSIGELSAADYKQLKNAGADRYLLRFETSDAALYGKLKPHSTLSKRLRCLAALRKSGYEVGSGIMAGLPGQSAESIAGDILLFKELDIDMIGIGPFIPHPHTPLSWAAPGTLDAVLKTVALTRLVTGNTNIPATTAVGTIDPLGRQKALVCGANVLMPNITPAEYRKYYEIYPDKICISEDVFKCRGCVEGMIKASGRTLSFGIGGRRGFGTEKKR